MVRGDFNLKSLQLTRFTHNPASIPHCHPHPTPLVIRNPRGDEGKVWRDRVKITELNKPAWLFADDLN